MKSQIEGAVRGIPPKASTNIPKSLTKKKCLSIMNDIQKGCFQLVEKKLKIYRKKNGGKMNDQAKLMNYLKDLKLEKIREIVL
jgi:hypothetical protein